MSNKMKLSPQGALEDRRGIRDIPDTIRRGARMNKTQFRFSLIAAAVILFVLIALIVLSKGQAAAILQHNESAVILREAMHAERIELSNKLAITDRYGKATTPDGKHLYVLQEVGQQTGMDTDKLYWLVYCSEEEAPKYEKAMKSYKQLIPLDLKDGKGLYACVSQAGDLSASVEKLAKEGIDAHFISLDELNGETDLSWMSEEDRKVLGEMLGELAFYNFGYNQDQAVRLSRGTKAQIAQMEGQRNTMRLIRVGLAVLMLCAAIVLVIQLKAKVRDDQSVPESKRRQIRVIALAVSAVLLCGILYTSYLINAKGDDIILVNELTAATDMAAKSDAAAGENSAEAPQGAAPQAEAPQGAAPQGAAPAGEPEEKFEYAIGKGKNAKTVTVSIPEQVGGAAAWRAVYYAALGLLIIFLFGLLYYFRYERDLAFPIFNTVVLILLMFITLYPVLNTVAYSFNDGTDAARAGIGLWPRVPSLDSYRQILTPTIFRAAGISAAKTIITTVLNLFWTGMLAYALSRREFVLRRFITIAMVLTMYVNAGLIPNFLLVSKTLGLSDKFWAYIITTMFSCFNMIIIRTYLVGLPNELVESARIDGAGDMRIYWQIIFPLCAPVLATVALFVAVGAWNSWFDTMLYMPNNRNLDTLQYYLMGKINTAGQQSNLANGSLDAANELARQSVSPRTVQCATTVVTALPILIIYPFLQRYFVTGMALGSVKG